MGWFCTCAPRFIQCDVCRDREGRVERVERILDSVAVLLADGQSGDARRLIQAYRRSRRGVRNPEEPRR